MVSSEYVSIVKVLAETILPCFDVLEPYWGECPSPLFNSHFDWHSSVHGHWAYLTLSRMQGITNSCINVQKVLARFTMNSLKMEQAYLKNNSTFELPYGQAWLLLLLPELLKWVEQDTDLVALIRELYTETHQRVLCWLERTNYPDGPAGIVLVILFCERHLTI